jgi:hypothetical protein
MKDPKVFLLTVLLASQLANANEQKVETNKLERKLIEAVMSEDELLLLIKLNILTVNEDGTLSIDRKVLKDLKEEGIGNKLAAAGSICSSAQ